MSAVRIGAMSDGCTRSRDPMNRNGRGISRRSYSPRIRSRSMIFCSQRLRRLLSSLIAATALAVGFSVPVVAQEPRGPTALLWGGATSRPTEQTAARTRF
jgi:hypothetical protein